MKRHAWLAAVLLPLSCFGELPVFANPGIAVSESFELSDYISKAVGHVTARVDIDLKERDGKRYYQVRVGEGDFFVNDIELNYDDLTTISEKRTDIHTNAVIESYADNGDRTIHFFNRQAGIDKNFTVDDRNIYTRYAYFVSFRGFPFETADSVSFDSYMYECGGALRMKVANLSRQAVTVKAGTFDCYQLDLSVAGWKSLFCTGTFRLFFSVTQPHRFVKYEEKADDGTWSTNEILRILK